MNKWEANAKSETAMIKKAEEKRDMCTKTWVNFAAFSFELEMCVFLDWVWISYTYTHSNGRKDWKKSVLFEERYI